MPYGPEASIDARTERCIADAQDSVTWPLGNPTFVEDGEFSRTVLFPDAQRPIVLKVPRFNKEFFSRYGETWFVRPESELLPYLETQSEDVEPPVAVPRLWWDSWEAHHPTYVALSYLPGRPLSAEEQATLHPAEQQQVGKTVAEHTNWLSTVLDIPTYKTLLKRHHGMPDRLHKFLTYHTVFLTHLEDIGMEELPNALYCLYEDYRRLKREGALQPHIVIHDDLNPGNTLFEGEEPQRAITGIIDYAVTKPGTPERNFRFLPFIGSIATRAAIERYEELTATTINTDALWFWARIQATVSACYAAINAQEAANSQVVKRMQQAWHNHPDFGDWSELTRLPKSSNPNLQKVS